MWPFDLGAAAVRSELRMGAISKGWAAPQIAPAIDMLCRSEPHCQGLRAGQCPWSSPSGALLGGGVTIAERVQ